ncbi:hypothetical protein [Bosea sp. Tri-44]|uniref:hypothetical protein n=1 Tax=Bosea sp. Tri-44 TaxID=1972137 RepID=UPI00100DA881|nr:hypothetical protein [Bosea sp. Tri-44]
MISATQLSPHMHQRRNAPTLAVSAAGMSQLGALSGHLKADSEKVVAASMLDAIAPSTLSTASAPSRKK